MIDLHKVWEDAKSELSVDITAVDFVLWIEPLLPFSIKDNCLILTAPTTNSRKTAERLYGDFIIRALRRALPSIKGAKIITEEEQSKYIDDHDEFIDNQIIINSKEKKKPRINPFVPRFTFDKIKLTRYEGNKMAVYAAESVAKNPGGAETYVGYCNPLFLYGGTGLGKTHLLHAIGNYLYDNMPSKKVLYVTSEKLINDFTEAIKSSNFNSFREKYRMVDVLMIDDIQFLQKRTGLQEAFFHIFNDLYQNNKQIVLTSDRLPSEISTLEDRMRSRFESGLIQDIQKPTLDDRVVIIKDKVLSLNYSLIESGNEDSVICLNDEATFYIAEKFEDNVRELEGAIGKVYMASRMLNDILVDINMVTKALQSNTQKKEELNETSLMNALCSYFRIQKADMVGRRRTKDVVDARQIGIWFFTELLKELPLEAIGQIFGGRDHSTVIHSRDTVASKIEENNKEILRKIKDIKDLL
ncbi:MAG: chromosomal replication initiator protein DnaA [Firmicutes bacterium]|nr:chromosomal replication initiator protein DnaA [Bacillota bacterium]